MKNIAIILVSILLISCAVKKETASPAEEDCWVYIRNAIELRKQKKYQSALDEIEKNGACDKPEAGMPYYYHLGWTYYEMGEYKKAIDAYSKGLKMQPDYIFAFWRRGLAYEKIGEDDKAQDDYKRAYEIGMKRNPKEFLETMEKYPDVKEKLINPKWAVKGATN